MTELTSKKFASELEAVRSRFLRMGGIVESMIEEAIETLSSGNLVLGEKVREREKEINRLEVEIDATIANIIALRQPTAIDLRLLLAVSKMLTDLERSGDEAEKVVKTAVRLYEAQERYVPVVDVSHIGNAVSVMIHQVLDAFARNDAVAAAGVLRSDKKVDKEWKSAMRSLSSYMIEDPRKITDCIDLMFIARSLERIGDHAKNMSERVIYMVQGEDVRHTGVKNAVAVATRSESTNTSALDE